MLYKIRVIRPAQFDKNFSPVYGLTIPQHIAESFSGTFFRVHSTEEGIFLQSGAQPKKEVLWYDQ